MRHIPTVGYARRGTLLVVVLGLITIFLALVLAITIRVYNSSKSATVLQQNVQAFIMLQAAKMVIAESGGGSLPGGAGSITGGDGGGGTALAVPNRPYGGQLGWFHIKGASSPYDVITAGGSGGAPYGGVSPRDTSISAGDPARNAYETRYYYQLTYDSGTKQFTNVTLKPATDNSLYPW